jgi:GNAT superfamily N-acetyltransferase
LSSLTVRPFVRRDRDQLAALVNAHVAAVVPGISVSVNALLNQMEREPGEFIVDPWVQERVTLVAEQRGRIVAAAHLHRYGATEEVGESYRDAGLIRWFLCLPPAPYWPDSDGASGRMMESCIAVLEEWGVRRQYADGTLPAPGVYGVPAQWPLVRKAYEEAGFRHDGKIEIVFLASVSELLPGEIPLSNLHVRRTVGINGTRFSAVLADQEIGYIEVEQLGIDGRFVRDSGIADVGNLHVSPDYRRQGVATWLLGEAADWLRIGGVARLLDYASPDETAHIDFLTARGFRELTRTQRGWTRDVLAT